VLLILLWLGRSLRSCGVQFIGDLLKPFDRWFSFVDHALLQDHIRERQRGVRVEITAVLEHKRYIRNDLGLCGDPIRTGPFQAVFDRFPGSCGPELHYGVAVGIIDVLVEALLETLDFLVADRGELGFSKDEKIHGDPPAVFPLMSNDTNEQ
jgi:hypothetical protein